MKGDHAGAMSNKRPYTHILKNLFHEQATELIPLLLPEYHVEEVLDVEMPELRTFDDDEPPSEFDQGIVKLAMPEATLIKRLHTEWIEHSGKFERAYRLRTAETEKPVYMVIEFQTEREDKDVARLLLSHLATVDRSVAEETRHKRKGKAKEKDHYIDAAVLCPFPSTAPAPIRDTFQGKVMLEFNFKLLGLWEKDARELLNTHVSAIYFLLPTMKNADAALLALAIKELEQRLQSDEQELGRHLTGLSLMLQKSETMSEREKQAAQEQLKRFAHLIKNDADDE